MLRADDRVRNSAKKTRPRSTGRSSRGSRLEIGETCPIRGTPSITADSWLCCVEEWRRPIPPRACSTTSAAARRRPRNIGDGRQSSTRRRLRLSESLRHASSLRTGKARSRRADRGPLDRRRSRRLREYRRGPTRDDHGRQCRDLEATSPCEAPASPFFTVPVKPLPRRAVTSRALS